MKTTVSKYDFERAFADADRNDNFSYEGLGLLFDYFEGIEESTGEESTGEEIELDVIAICCDYCEDTVENIASNHSIDLEGMDDDEQLEVVRDYLNDHTLVVGETVDGFVYAAF